MWFTLRTECQQVYGDSIYVPGSVIVRGFRGAVLPPAARAQNKALNRCRTAVEWGFGRANDSCKIMSATRKHQLLRLGGAPLAQLHRVCFLLTNCFVCCSASQTSTFFAVAPPTVESYLAGGVQPQTVQL